jgi:hypothetical protein
MAAVTEWKLNAAENAKEEIMTVETRQDNAREDKSRQDKTREDKARQEQLLVLVGELLRTNEDLRQKVARLETQGACAETN